MTTLEIILSITTVVFFLMWRYQRKLSKFYWERWDHFEGEFYKYYDKWIKKLSKEELLVVQNESRIKEGLEPWTEPV
jgi:hypothetical protein